MFDLDMLSIGALRTLCNDNGMSCKNSKGKYLSKDEIIALLRPIVTRGTRTTFPSHQIVLREALNSGGRVRQWDQDEDIYVVPRNLRKRNPHDPLPSLPKTSRG